MDSDKKIDADYFTESLGIDDKDFAKKVDHFVQ